MVEHDSTKGPVDQVIKFKAFVIFGRKGKIVLGID
jgi:hypothetical protein